jgi:flagellar basal-body rod modification protein FlgD
MSVPQTSLGLFTTQANSPTSGTSGTSGQGSLTTQDFLNLLVTELQNQDPLNPVNSGTFLQQMSTLTDVSAIGQMTQSVANLAALTASQSAVALIGQTVTLTTGTGTVSGQVSGVEAGPSGPQLLVGGTLYPLSAVAAVGTQAAATTSGSAGGTAP